MRKELNERGWPQAKVDFFEQYNIRPVRPMRVPRKLLEKKIKFYEKRKIPYWFENTNERETIYAAGTWGTHMNKESSFKANELQFIKEVKDHIIKNETYKLVKNNFTSEKKIERIKYSVYKKIKPGTEFKDCLELDLKGAYWEQLNMLPGLLSEKIYKKGLNVEKKTRLACAGTLNKTVGCVAFNGKESVVLDDIESEKTGFLWHTISYKIGQVLWEAFKIAKEDCIFGWVDALFIHGDKKDEIIQLFKKAGFNTTVYKCERICFEEKKIVVHSKEKGKWVTKTQRERITLENGKKAIKVIKRRVYTQERPFPYKKIASKK